MIIFITSITLWCTYDLTKKTKKGFLNDEAFSIILINSIALIIGICVLLFPTNTSTPTKSYTKTEVDSLIYQRVMNSSEYKLYLANGDNVCKTEVIDEFNKNITTNLGIYKVHYPFFRGDNIKIEAFYFYEGKYSHTYIEVEDSEEAIAKAIRSLYREKLLELLNINSNNYNGTF